MTIREYFQRADTPQAQSPVGRLMVRILDKNPGMEYGAARAEATRLLQQAAARKAYRMPHVYSPAEQAELDAKGKAYWTSRKAARAA
jgi:hypothetical protein